MTTHVDIDLFSLQYKKLTDPFELFEFDLNEYSPGALPSFLHQSKTFSVPVMEPGEVTAVVYWFDMVLLEDIKLTTLDQNSHWRQAAVMQKQHLMVSSGDNLKVKATCKSSLVDIKIQL